MKNYLSNSVRLAFLSFFWEKIYIILLIFTYVHTIFSLFLINQGIFILSFLFVPLVCFFFLGNNLSICIVRHNESKINCIMMYIPDYLQVDWLVKSFLRCLLTSQIIRDRFSCRESLVRKFPTLSHETFVENVVLTIPPPQ